MFSSMPTVKTPFLCVCWFLHVQRLNVSPIAILVVWARVGGSFQWFRNYEKILAFLQKHKAQVPENPNGKRLLYEFVRDDRDGRIISQYSIADNKSVYIHAYMYIHAYIKKYIHIIYIDTLYTWSKSLSLSRLYKHMFLICRYIIIHWMHAHIFVLPIYVYINTYMYIYTHVYRMYICVTSRDHIFYKRVSLPCGHCYRERTPNSVGLVIFQTLVAIHLGFLGWELMGTQLKSNIFFNIRWSCELKRGQNSMMTSSVVQNSTVQLIGIPMIYRPNQSGSIPRYKDQSARILVTAHILVGTNTKLLVGVKIWPSQGP